MSQDHKASEHGRNEAPSRTDELLEKIRTRRRWLARMPGYTKNPYEDRSPDYLVLNRHVPRFKNSVGYAEPFRDIKTPKERLR